MLIDHIPDNMPEPLRSLDWKEMTNNCEWYDGTQLLVAVPVMYYNSTKWVYEFSIISLRCDEHLFEISCNDDGWGWELEDIDYFVEIC